jgi:hypothetical protein
VIEHDARESPSHPGSASTRAVTSASRPSVSTTTSPGSRFGAGCSRRPRSSPVVS